MTTDRTAAAPQRATNASQRPSAPQEKTPAPAPDAFSALLSAATPKADDGRQAPRADRPHLRRDEDHRSSRADRAHGRPERGDGHRAHAARRPDAAKRDQPAAQADAAPTAATGDATTAPTGAPVATVPAEAQPAQTAVAPNLIAAQLAGPLPPQDADAGQGTQPAAGLVPAGAVVPGAPGAQAGVPGQPVPGAPGTVDPNAAQGNPDAAAQAAPTGPQADAPAQPAAPKLDAPLNLDALKTAATQPDTAAQAAPAQPQATAAAADAKPQDAGPAVQNTTPAQPLTPPVAAPAQPLSAPAGLQRAVPLGHVARTMGTLLHVAAEKGVTHARLNLKPVELGGIEVRLQSSPQGVSAQLVADSPEAARMLTQASDDLRRQLADRNVNLLSLDVSTSSDQRQASAGAFGAGDDGGFGEARSGGTSANGRAHDGDAQAMEAAPAETTLVLPGGVLVDVLA